MPEHEPLPQDKADRGGFRWRPRQLFEISKRTMQEFVEDKTPKQAAALAYYALFAIGPLLLLAISIAGLVFGAEAARQAVTGEVGRLAGARGAEAIDTLVAGSARDGGGIVGTLVGLVVLVFGAAGVFAQLKEALNRIWEVEKKEVKGFAHKAKRYVRDNIVSFAGVLGTGFLLIVSLVVSAGLSALAKYASGLLPGFEVLWLVLNFVVSALILTALFALIFRFLPDARVAWKDVWVGAAVTGVLFAVGQVLIGLYLGAGPLTNRYGAAGSIVVMLVWVYYSAMMLFLGAQFTQVYANMYGSHVRANERGEPLEEATVRKQDRPENEGTDRESSRRRERGRGA